MKRKLLFLITSLILIASNSIFGQVSSYTFSSNAGTYSAITGGTVIVTGTTSLDSWVSSSITIPTFNFNCVDYTTAYVTSNGMLSLGGSAPSSFEYNCIANNTGSGICIAPFNADLDRVNSNASTEIRWQQVGTEIIFQWVAFKRYAVTESFDFQVRLNTSNGNVVFVYKLNSGPAASTSYQPVVGIRTSSTDYNNRLVGTGAETWAASLAGTANTSTCRFTSTAPAKSFASGLTYTFSSPAACSGTPAAGTTVSSMSLACLSTSFSLSVTGSASGCGVTYQWQSSPNGSAWSNISGATSATYDATQTVATYYRRITTCSGNSNTGSSSLLINMDVASNCYCTSTSTSSTSYFNAFSTTGGTTNITNNSSGYSTNGYGNFTNLIVTQLQGSSVNFTSTLVGTTVGVNIWVDWNQDGDFSDAGEKVYASAGYVSAASGSFTVPLTATPGNTRMRIRLDYSNTNPSECGSISRGETEDYTFSVTPLPVCTGTPNGGTAVASVMGVCTSGSTVLSVTGSTAASGLTYQWQSSPDGSSWTNIGGATNLTHTATVSITTYFRRLTICGGNSGPSSSVLVTVSFLYCYCTSTATSTGDMDITRVNFGTINNTTTYNSLTGTQGTATGTAGMYSDFRNSGVPVPSVVQFSTVTGTVVITQGSSNYSHQVVIYIDFNQNGTFDTGEETIIWTNANSGATNTINYSIDIPGTALPGNTLMRVVCIENSTAINPCGTYTWGETEDYLINITEAPACTGTPTAGTASINVTTFCTSGNPILTLSGYTTGVSGISLQWQVSTSNAPYAWTDLINGNIDEFAAPPVATTSYYRCIVRCGSSTVVSNILTLTSTAQSILTTNNPVTINCNSTATLTATASGGTVRWYTAPTGGTSVFTGTSYTTPSISANTTYYCVANSGSLTETAGMPAKAPSTSTTSTATGRGINFNVTQALTLNSVTIYPIKTGNVVISYQNSAGVEQAATASIAVNGGKKGTPVVIPLGWNIPIGNGYRLILKTSSVADGIIYDANTSYPYTSPSGALSVTNGYWAGATSTNYYFYNLNLSINCESTPRTPVNVVLGGGVTAPVCSTTPFPANAATGICPVSPIITWAASVTACRAATSYLLFFGTNAAADNIINGQNIGNVLSYNLGNLTGSTQYYWRIVPVNSAGNATGCSIWSFTTVANPGSLCGSLLGSGVTNIASLPYSSGAGTTAGAVNDLTSSNVVSCGSSLYLGGEDRVWVFTPTTSGNVTISLSSTGSYTGLILYEGCPLSAGVCGAPPGTCIGSSTGFEGSRTLNVCLVAGTTYYLILDSWPSPTNNPYSNLSITAPSGVLTPPNDLPCNATSLTLGSSGSGNNQCASSAGEPTRPTCWTGGVLNTVWFTIVAPASGQLSIRTTTGSLTDTQIGVFQGSCSALTQVSGTSCNDNISGCGSSQASLVNLTGLTAGNTYYISVDGAYDLSGSFSILAIDPVTQTFPVTPGQDCSAAFPTCNQVLTISDPGYSNTGSVCDFSGDGNCTGGERSSVWYTIDIASNGFLKFDLIPNDYSGGSSGSETDYDFLVWKTIGTGSTTCAGIASNSATGLVACNYSYLGVTGLSNNGNSPGAYPGFDAAYETQIPVVAGEQYIICISNFTQSTSGFTIDYLNSNINYTPSPTVINWTGSTSTAWANSANWGGCAIPSCTVSANVTALAPRMPVISTNQTVNNLTIEPGATLTINAGVTLTVCGNFTNNGTLIMSPTATLFFNNTATHTLSGSLIGTNGIGNITVNQTAGSVIFGSDIDIKGNLLTSTATSIINSNGRYVRVAGNFTNNTANTTYFNVAGGTLEFNGTAAQVFTNTNGELVLNNVTLNHSGTGVTLTGANSNLIVGTNGLLTLTNGIVITGAREVRVMNPLPSSCNEGSSSSYVQGFLRRYIGNTGNYFIPVGQATKGYQLASVNFTSAPNVHNLLSSFSPTLSFGTSPATIIDATESIACNPSFNVIINPLDNGEWIINSFQSNLTTQIFTSGTYDITLSPTNFTNPFEFSTIMKNGVLQGARSGCSAGGDVVTRTGLTGFSVFGIPQVTAGILPIKLINFKGEATAKFNQLTWQTETEIDALGFEIESSYNGKDFKKIVYVEAAGNSKSIRNYSFKDYKYFSPVTYYRLKQIEKKGVYYYSDIVPVINNNENKVITSELYPNPTFSNVEVALNVPYNASLSIEITDLSGRILEVKSLNLEEGKHIVPFEISKLSSGVYLVRIIFDDIIVKVDKLVKQ
jgi:hypothetical protein